MARAGNLWIPLLMMLVLAGGCSADAPAPARASLNPTAGVYHRWYDEIVAGFRQKDIAASAGAANATAEYRVVRDVSLLRYDYYSLQVFADGTGRFERMARVPEYFNGNRLLRDDHAGLDAAQTGALLKALADNDFWNLPAAQGDDRGEDGETVYIEGAAAGKTHFVRTWSQSGDYNSVYRATQIYDAFDALAQELWGAGATAKP